MKIGRLYALTVGSIPHLIHGRGEIVAAAADFDNVHRDLRAGSFPIARCYRAGVSSPRQSEKS
jgi:hypothetical protein